MRKETIVLYKDVNHIQGYGFTERDCFGVYPKELQQKNIVKIIADIVYKKNIKLIDYNIVQEFIPNGEYYIPFNGQSDYRIPRGDLIHKLEVYFS